MLKYSKLRKYLKESSDRFYCSENIDFFENILDYKMLKGQDDRKMKSQEIFNLFLKKDSQREINISNEQKDHVERNLEISPVDLFQVLECEIKLLIKQENYHKFIHCSEDFAKMLEENENVTVIYNGKIK
jgi:formylmethanofuran dehydrogenase subunit E